jgi:hypothetical protein
VEDQSSRIKQLSHSHLCQTICATHAAVNGGGGGLGGLDQPHGSKPGTPFGAALQALQGVSPGPGGMHPGMGHTPPPGMHPQGGNPYGNPAAAAAALGGLAGASPPPSMAALLALQSNVNNAAAAAAAAASGQMSMANSLEYQAAYHAAYQAAMMSQQQGLLGGGAGGGNPHHHHHANPQLAALQAAQGAALAGLHQGGGAGAAALHLAAAQAAAAAQLGVPPGALGFPPGAGGGGMSALTAAAAAAAAAAASINGGSGRGGGPRDGGLRDDRRGGGRDGGKRGERGGGGERGSGDRDRNGGDRDRNGGAARREKSEGEDALAAYAAKYANFEDVAGQLLAVAQDQNGCRFLQRKFDEGGAAAIAVVFPELLDHVIVLMTDPFGNYLIQKLLDRCSEEQRLQVRRPPGDLTVTCNRPSNYTPPHNHPHPPTQPFKLPPPKIQTKQVLKRVADDGELVTVALNTHGTRAVQKLIETLTSREQRAIVISALSPGVVTLIKDLNGNHVVQRCLQRLGPDDSQFVYEAAKAHCVEVATHRHGCCVLQRCVDFATPTQKAEVVAEVARNALVLSQVRLGRWCAHVYVWLACVYVVLYDARWHACVFRSAVFTPT